MAFLCLSSLFHFIYIVFKIFVYIYGVLLTRPCRLPRMLVDTPFTSVSGVLFR